MYMHSYRHVGMHRCIHSVHMSYLKQNLLVTEGPGCTLPVGGPEETASCSLQRVPSILEAYPIGSKPRSAQLR